MRVESDKMNNKKIDNSQADVLEVCLNACSVISSYRLRIHCGISDKKMVYAIVILFHAVLPHDSQIWGADWCNNSEKFQT